MARRPRDHRLETRETRTRLKQSHEISWRSLSPGLYIGYRKKKRAIGLADDFTETEQHSAERQAQFLSYGEAVKKIFSGVKEPPKKRGRWTVADASEAYLEWFRLNWRSYHQTEQQVACHILPVLGEIPHGTRFQDHLQDHLML